MRGFIKAAALLSSTFISVSAFVVPDPESLGVGDSKATVEYRKSPRSRDCHWKLTKQQVPQKL